MKITTDRALIFSAVLLILYTIVCEIQIFFDKVPDSTLTGCFFIAFGVAEGGYCMYIHKLKKQRENDNKPVRSGDITGYDDAEVIDVEVDDGK